MKVRAVPRWLDKEGMRGWSLDAILSSGLEVPRSQAGVATVEMER